MAQVIRRRAAGGEITRERQPRGFQQSLRCRGIGVEISPVAADGGARAALGEPQRRRRPLGIAHLQQGQIEQPFAGIVHHLDGHRGAMREVAAPEALRPVAQRGTEAGDAGGARRKIGRRAGRWRHDAPPVRLERKGRQVTQRRQRDIVKRTLRHRFEERQMARLPLAQPRRQSEVMQQRGHEHGLAGMAQAGDGDAQAAAQDGLADAARRLVRRSRDPAAHLIQQVVVDGFVYGHKRLGRRLLRRMYRSTLDLPSNGARRDCGIADRDGGAAMQAGAAGGVHHRRNECRKNSAERCHAREFPQRCSAMPMCPSP